MSKKAEVILIRGRRDSFQKTNRRIQPFFVGLKAIAPQLCSRATRLYSQRDDEEIPGWFNSDAALM